MSVEEKIPESTKSTLGSPEGTFEEKKNEGEFDNVELWMDVKNIPIHWTNSELAQFFQEKSQIIGASVDFDPNSSFKTNTGISSVLVVIGSGKILFTSLSEAYNVTDKISGKEFLPGCKSPILIYPSQDSHPGFKFFHRPTSLIIPPPFDSLSETEKQQMLKAYGEIKELKPNSNLVEMATPEAALKAIRALGAKPVFETENGMSSFGEDEESCKIICEAPPQKIPPPIKEPPSAPQIIGVVPAPSSIPSIFPTSTPIQPPSMMKPIVYVEYRAVDGRPYFFNTTTQVTQWERPVENALIIKPQPIQPTFRGARPFYRPRRPFMTPKVRGPPGCNVFIFHMPCTWTDKDLFYHFKGFGHILGSRVVFDVNTGQHKGYGFVSFDNPQSAQTAVTTMNGFSVLGKRLKVDLKKGDMPTPIFPASS